MSKLIWIICILSFSMLGMAQNPQHYEINTSWISREPEVLTYHTKDKNGEGLFQISISKDKKFIEAYINIISNYYSKFIYGKMSLDMKPIQSNTTIIVRKRVVMKTISSYRDNQINIATTIKPYNRILKNTLPYKKHIIDFSQIPFLERIIPLKVGQKYLFSSLNPRTNKLVPLSIIVLNEDSIRGIACYKIKLTTFEGESIHWVEKAPPHRIIRIEQRGLNRISTLIF